MLHGGIDPSMEQSNFSYRDYVKLWILSRSVISQPYSTLLLLCTWNVLNVSYASTLELSLPTSLAYRNVVV